jgi:hypothetical protein
MDIMNPHFIFFEEYIKPVFRKDTNTTIDDTLIALAYPSIILIGPAPYFNDAVVDVTKAGIDIEPDKYSLYCFLAENPEFCQKVVEAHDALHKFFKAWQSK